MSNDVDNVITQEMKELCFYMNQRNKINLERHRARYKVSYYKKQLEIVTAHTSKATSNNSRIAYILRTHPRPRKWIKKGKHALRCLILKYEAEYANAKYRTMNFTIENRERVNLLFKSTNLSPWYDNGAVVTLSNRDNICLYRKHIRRYADDYEASLAIHKMLTEDSHG